MTGSPAVGQALRHFGTLADVRAAGGHPTLAPSKSTQSIPPQGPGATITKYFNFKATLVLGAMLVMPLSQATAMTKDEYKASKSRISADYKSAKASCAPMAGSAKDICVEEAKGKEKVAKAELEYGYTGKAKDQNKILVAKADSTYKVAKERCDDRSGNEKDVCVKEAKATQTKALADAKMSLQVGTARTDANQDKRDADYKVAVEKCDAMAGDAKSSCVAQAKTRFGKN